MPVWHKATRKWVEEGKLVLLGVTQEQHAERCRLFAQWHQMEWPILHDPVNVLRSRAVPLFVALDEHGIVRSTRPRLPTFERDFLMKEFPAPNKPVPRYKRPSLAELRKRAADGRDGLAWRRLGDSLAIFGLEDGSKDQWGSRRQADAAIAAYQQAVKRSPKSGDSLFRLGVAYRQRFDSSTAELSDFSDAIGYWQKALNVDPNQYIWRRRIQQYGPRLQKPYPFYDWVRQASTDIEERGEKPIRLRTPPAGAELASPRERFAAEEAGAKSPDPEGKIQRDADRLIGCSLAAVPTRVRAGRTVRLHLVMRPNKQAHWNNEAEPTRIWLDLPAGWKTEKSLLKSALPRAAETRETRELGVELKAPTDAGAGPQTIKGYALYYVCEERDGRCLFLRQDFSLKIEVGR